MTAETVTDRGRRGRRVANGALHELRHGAEALRLQGDAVSTKKETKKGAWYNTLR